MMTVLGQYWNDITLH